MPKARARSNTDNINSKYRPALTPAARENQLIALSTDLAEQKLRDGTASSQLIVHFLKLATEKERLEREKLEKENELLRAKTKAVESGQRIEELYEKAMRAMRSYSGNWDEAEDDDDSDFS